MSFCFTFYSSCCHQLLSVVVTTVLLLCFIDFRIFSTNFDTVLQSETNADREQVGGIPMVDYLIQKEKYNDLGQFNLLYPIGFEAGQNGKSGCKCVLNDWRLVEVALFFPASPYFYFDKIGVRVENILKHRVHFVPESFLFCSASLCFLAWTLIKFWNRSVLSPIQTLDQSPPLRVWTEGVSDTFLGLFDSSLV